MKINLARLPVYFIHLDSEADKADQLTNTLTELGFHDLRPWPGVPHANKTAGCALAHNRLLQHLATQDLPAIALEVDVKPYQFRKTITTPAHTDAYYLGLSSWGLNQNVGRHRISAVQKTPDLWRLYNMLAAHAIVYLNPDYIRWLIQATQTMIDLRTNQDKARAQTLKYWNIYAPTEPYFYQAGKHSKATKINLNHVENVEPKALL